jgi:DNA repair exonuclease SbcCD ATPase subunit
MKLSQVEAQGFRAFGRPIQFDTAADVVVLVGPNGAGKTSLFDALEWGLFGQIKRLPATRDAVGQDYVRNQFFPDREPLVSLFLADGESATVVRRSERSVVVAEADRELQGNEADEWLRRLVLPLGEPTSTAPVDAFERTFLLGQERIVDFVRDTSPRDRFDSLSTLLGADIVRHFYNRVGTWRRAVTATTSSADAEVARADRAIEALRLQKLATEARASPASALTVERLTSAFELLRAPAARLGLQTPTSRDGDIEFLIAAIDDLRSQANAVLTRATAAETDAIRLEGIAPEMENLGSRRQELVSAQASAASTLTAAEARAASIESRVRRLKEEQTRVDVEHDLVRRDGIDLAEFLTNARTRITTKECPVCGQPIVPETVLERLANLLDQVPDAERDLAAAAADLESRKRVLDTEQHRVQLDVRTARLEKARIGTEISALDHQVDSWNADVRELSAAWGGRPLAAIKPATAKSKASASRLLSQLDDLRAEADSVLARRRLDSLEESSNKLEAERGTAVMRQSFVKTVGSILDELVSDAKALEISVVQDSIARQLPSLQAVYRRLNPHPLFETLDVRFGAFAERGEVYYRVSAGQASGNASMLFSTAQLNAVAVSVFVSLNLLRSAGGLDLLLLDDPIQNMDDYNVLGLVDLLRSLRPNRQLIVSTHDTAIGELVRRKLRPRTESQRTILHRFVSTDEAGPHVVTAVDEYTHSDRLLAPSG